jgi:cytochrome c oxidase cbb3-type subunit 3
VRITILLVCFGLLLLVACQREKHDIRPSPTQLAIYGDAAKQSDLRPGGPIGPEPVVKNPYTSSGYDISEGQRLFNWYNCSGCHANGGGGIGPPLIKKSWVYGGEPANSLRAKLGRPRVFGFHISGRSVSSRKLSWNETTTYISSSIKTG